LAQGVVGVMSGIGATISTTLFGFVAQSLGRTADFLIMAVIGGVAVVLVWLFLPETRRSMQRS